MARTLQVFQDRTFTRFAVFHAVDLFSYNQLYFALPLVAASSTSDPEKILSLSFACLSALILVGQVPLSRFVAQFKNQTVLRAGYSFSALGLLAYALAIYGSKVFSEGLSATFVLAGSLCIGVGHLLSSPQGLAYVSQYAPQGSQAAYLGFIATCGGVAVLLGNLVLGSLLDLMTNRFPGLAWSIWVLIALLIFGAIKMQKGLPALKAENF